MLAKWTKKTREMAMKPDVFGLIKEMIPSQNLFNIKESLIFDAVEYR
ncbi:unnamed protein product, partial [marine sediment metagenome]